MAGGYQTQVGVQPAPAFAGDFIDTNPRDMVNAGPGGLVSGPDGLTIARFAWLQQSFVDADNAAIIANNYGWGSPAGIVLRGQQGLNTTFLSSAGMWIPGGYAVELLSKGGVWVKNDGSAKANVGMKAYAEYGTGKIVFAAASTPRTISATGSSVAQSTFEVTGSVSGNVLTVTAVSSGIVVAGATISGTGIASGTKIVKQLGGTAGGVGTYALSITDQTAASTTVSGTYGTLTVGTTSATTWGPGQTISGSGVDAGTRITQNLTGVGGAGTYVVDSNTLVSSTTITAARDIETSFFAVSSGAAGELVKITNRQVP